MNREECTSEQTHPFEMPSLVLSGDMTIKPGWQLGPRRLTHYEIVYFPYGTDTVFTASGQNYRLSEPCITVIKQDEEHAYLFDPNRPVRHMFIVFYWSRKEGRHPFADLLNRISTVKIPPSSPVPLYFQELLKLSAHRTPQWRNRCSSLMFLLLEEIREQFDSPAEHRTPPPLPLTVAVEYMNRHLGEPISIERLARHVGWTHSYFTRIFYRGFGMSPSRYLIRLRIDRGAYLLLHDTLSVKEIAANVGFANEYYFSRMFKQLKGIPPTLYRQRYADPRYAHIAAGHLPSSDYPVNRYFEYDE